jgi:NAD(P)-dependent dehydrogenase (short-subunit alcohol dehydrogenase family)
MNPAPTKYWPLSAQGDKFESMSIESQSVVIIGGSSGIGLAIAKEAVDAGADVTIAGRSQNKLDQARQAIAGDVTALTVDVSDEQSLKNFFKQIGGLDHLIVTGASVKTGPWHEFSVADARASMDSKFWGQYMAAHYAQIRPQGSITFFSGILSRRPSAGQASLAAINGAVDALGRALAVELAPVRVNVISPGLTDTPAHAGMPDDARKRMFAAAAKHSLVGRVGRPEDVASLALELMCNHFMTGVIVDVDGGGLLAGCKHC